MLILSRKANESIIIGDNIRVTVTSVRGRYVRIGIEAPGEVGIYREELLPIASTPGEKTPRDIKERVKARRELEAAGRAEFVTMDA